MTVLTEEDKAYLQELDETLHAALCHYYKEQQRIKSDEMVWDNEGPSVFTVIGFNHPLNPPEGMFISASDREVAIASASSAIMPDVQSTAEGTIGPEETIQHGVQAVAGAMLLSSLQHGAIIETMKRAQGVMLRAIKRRRELQ